jgi:hypothetical protein
MKQQEQWGAETPCRATKGTGMKKLSWLLAVLLGLPAAVVTGCGGGDDDAASAGGGGGGTTGDGSSTNGTTPALTARVLLDRGSIPVYGGGYSITETATAVTPADGIVTLTVTWEGMDQLTGAPVNIPLSVNLGGVTMNGSASSPAVLSAGSPANYTWDVTLTNPNAGAVATAHITLIWTPN